MSEKTFQQIPLSVLDLAPVLQDKTPADSFQNSASLALAAEELGFHRYWLAEHHNMPGIASSATAVVIGYIAGSTQRIRVGSGGVMLPNHSPLVIAEQFGTLESMYPGRIDLGLGRAPGTDPKTEYALRRDLTQRVEQFPALIGELQAYFRDDAPVSAVPGAGLSIPLWLLGSSRFSASLAAEKGLPYSFASHFSPDYLMPALQIYRESFRPSEQLARPYTMLGVNIVAAENDNEAARLATSFQMQFLSLRSGRPIPLPPPANDVERIQKELEASPLSRMIRSDATITGSPKTVKTGLERLLRQTRANELIISTQVYDPQARIRSYEIVAEVKETLEV